MQDNDLDNWDGGYIVIGVEEENGRPVYPLKGVPVEKLDKYQKEIFANKNASDKFWELEKRIKCDCKFSCNTGGKAAIR